jgi:hypothetical protein
VADAGDRRRMAAIGQRIESFGVVVRWMPGWETRGLTWARVPVSITEHHDASSIKSGEWGAIGLILDGSARGIPGMLAQFQHGRALDNVPKVAIIGCGRASHAGRGGPYRFPDGLLVPADAMNSWGYGQEVANNGVGEPYRDALHYSIDATSRAVLEVCG